MPVPIIHGEFYDSLDSSIVEDCLRKAILKEGLPQRLFFDNGKQFRNKWMERACAILGIKLIFTAPYSPESKGKIERFNQTIGSFLAEAHLKNSTDLSEFNQLLQVWLSECYHRMETRKVDKSGCISFDGKKYEVGVIYIGRTVDVVFDPADTSVLTVEDTHFNTSFRIKELVIGAHTGPRPKLPDSLTPVKPLTSRLLDEKQKRYNSRELSNKRAISYAELNQSTGTDKGGESHV